VLWAAAWTLGSENATRNNNVEVRSAPQRKAMTKLEIWFQFSPMR